MSGILVKIRQMSGNKSCEAKLPKKYAKNCINRLSNITHLALYANYFMLLLLNFAY